MTPEQRAETEAKADRFLRRGELADAAVLYEQILSAFPGDPAVESKLENLRDSLNPSELHAAKQRQAAPQKAKAQPKALTPEQEGEEFFAQGDYVNAAAAYRRALKEKPDNELLKERLVEIFSLAQAQNPGARPSKPALRVAPPPPQDPEDVLKSLLGRIAERKRSA